MHKFFFITLTAVFFGCQDTVSPTIDVSNDVGSDLVQKDVTPDEEEPEIGLNFSLPFSKLATHETEFSIHGTTNDANAIDVNGVPATSTDNFATWNATIPLELWDNEIQVTATHLSGTSQTRSIMVRRDARFAQPRAFAIDGALRKAWALFREPSEIVEYDFTTNTRRRLVILGGKYRKDTLAYDALNSKLYTFESVLEEIDIASGTVRLISTNNSTINHLMFAEGSLYSNSVEGVGTVDLNTGITTRIVGEGPPVSESKMFFDGDEQRIIVIKRPDAISVDLQTGDRRLLTSSPSLFAEAWDGATNTMFSVSRLVQSINLDTGLVSEVGTALFSSPVQVFDPVEGVIIASGYNGMWKIRPSDGVSTSVVSHQFPNNQEHLFIYEVIPTDTSLWFINKGLFSADFATTKIERLAAKEMIWSMMKSEDTAYLVYKNGQIEAIDIPTGTKKEIIGPDFPNLELLQSQTSMAVDEATKTLFVMAKKRIFALDMTTNILTEIPPGQSLGEFTEGNGLIFKNGKLYTYYTEGRVI